uniref:Fucolectin tachylectin-4 pentraxin-1 domain-containing protein n=1 Tax=Biomphalaria glabrata TaxID=6526 RepID=A0A2C9KH61_BIOGL
MDYYTTGRNVALVQKTSQTSTYSANGVTFGASKAVDGYTSSDFNDLRCSSTNDNDPKPMWSVTFPLSQITRYVLYNRGGSNEGRLVGFVLSGENSGSRKFDYRDTFNQALPVYIVTDAAKNGITEVTISTPVMVTLCEVEIYGECPAGTYTTPDLQCTNCPATCPNSCHIDTGICESSGYKYTP